MHFFARHRENIRQSSMSSRLLWPTIQFVLEPNSLRKRVRVRFLFIGSSAARVCRAVNEQRQGITVAVVSCLFL